MKQKTLLTIITSFLISFSVCAQPEIKGPACVVPGTEYDYFISGSPDSVAEVSICITGGSFADTKVNCKTIKPHSSVRINWDDKANNAGLSITHSAGKNSLDVTVTTALDPGDIVSSIKKQKLKYDSVSAVITCSPASGGSCSPVYKYQWQQSANALGWTDIIGANGPDLPPQGALKEPVFYRRKVTEDVSGTIAYSTIATTFVEADYKNR